MEVRWNFPPDLSTGCHVRAVLTRCLLCLLNLLRHEILPSYSQVFYELSLLPAHKQTHTHTFVHKQFPPVLMAERERTLLSQKVEVL